MEQSTSKGSSGVRDETPATKVKVEVIQNILRHVSPDLELIDYSLKPGTAAGDNYMSVMYAVEILAWPKQDTEPPAIQTLHVMLKTMPRKLIRQQLLAELSAFVREARMYEEVFPTMVAFQKSSGKWESCEIVDQFPKCYVTFCDGKSDYIAMENLKQQGFRMVSRQKGLDFPHSALVARHMARMHAVSHSMFRGDHAAIHRAFPILEEKLFLPLAQMPAVMRTFFQESLNHESNLLRRNGYDVEAQVIEALGSEEYYNEQHRLVAGPAPNAVIGHGDAWTNNILFKYSENDMDCKSPLELKFVDFQNSRVSSRMVDFVYFLYSSPQMQVMNERWEELLKIYHEEFTAYSTRLGCCDPELMYERLLEEFTEYKLYGVVMGILLCPAISASKDDLPDMEHLPDAAQYTADRFGQVLGNAMKGDTLLTKLLNLVNNHALKIPFIVELVSKKKNVQK